MRKLLSSIALCAAAVCSTSAIATTVINWSDSGSYDDTGAHRKTTTNYVAGPCFICQGPPGTQYHNFFVFDTSAVQGTVTSGILRLRPGYVAADGIYSLFDVSTPIPVLLAGGLGLLSVYDDLGSGTSYGSASVLTSQSMSRDFVDVVLNEDAIKAINANRGLFALGGSFAADAHAFGGTYTDEQRQLRLETIDVPEPPSIGLLGAGLALLATLRRRRKVARPLR